MPGDEEGEQRETWVSHDRVKVFIDYFRHATA